jgi:hypothetical protein
MPDAAQQEQLRQAEKGLQDATDQLEKAEKKGRKDWLSDVRNGLTQQIFTDWAQAKVSYRAFPEFQ